MSAGSGGIRGGILELPVGGLLLAGGRFSPRCGQFGSTGTRSSSGVSLHLAMPLYTPPRGLIFPGTEAAYAPRTMYPCYDRPCCHAFINSMEIGGTALGTSLPLIKKKVEHSNSPESNFFEIKAIKSLVLHEQMGLVS